MARNPRYDILFEPVQIGPVTAPNRFYQTPHATGMGTMKPNSSIALRGTKAEGGWGVVCTEYCSIHPTADDEPYAYLSLWDDHDLEQCAAISEAIHEHGSLSAIELWHGGFHCLNRNTREVPLAPSACSAEYMGSTQVREMDLHDIQSFRRWHRDAALRAQQAGYDIIYVYAGHEFLPFQFLSPRFNQRSDQYGGSFENRSRLLRELIEDTREAVGDRCAVAVRLAIDELQGERGISAQRDGRQVIETLGELPDLWDIALGGSLRYDSCSSRFSAEGYQEEYASVVKSLTSKPVVSVGRFTSPDTMVSQIKRGIQDFIGAARPSIADPFLPQKIDRGFEDQIRECIGCNICRSANNEGAPLRCTQNPTMGEEWRRGWHPENIPAASSTASILIIGGGPAGLEAALALGKRGHQVTLAEAKQQLGGRLVNESGLPGLQNWIRVRDYRAYMIGQMDNIDVYLESPLSAEDAREFSADAIVLATGSRWRRNGTGLSVRTPVQISDDSNLITPEDVFAGMKIQEDVLIYDDEHYMMAGALAEKLLQQGVKVTYVTPSNMISSWSTMTNEQEFIQQRLETMGIKTIFAQKIDRIDTNVLTTKGIYNGESIKHDFGCLLLVTGRESDDRLFHALDKAATRIGDCLVPSSIADAVYSGHKFAREYGEDPELIIPRRERAVFQSTRQLYSAGDTP